MITLKIEKRENSKDLASLREEGVLPAVMYGAKEKSESIAVDLKEFIKVFKEAGESAVIELDSADGKKNALINEVQLDPVKNVPIHADFYIVEKGKEVEVSVPLEFVGVSTAVKELGATLVKVMHELPIKGVPSKLPHVVEIDISALKDLESRVSAEDVVLPDGIELNVDGNETVASVSVAKEEEEDTQTADIADIEVEKKGKKEEEEKTDSK